MRSLVMLLLLLITAAAYSSTLFLGKGTPETRNYKVLYNFGEKNLLYSESGELRGFQKLECSLDHELYVVSHHSGYPINLDGDNVFGGNEYQKLMVLDKEQFDLLENDGYEFFKVSLDVNLPSRNHSFERVDLNLNRSVTIDEMISNLDPDRVEQNMQAMEDMGTRYFMHENRREVAMWIVDKFLEYGAETAYLDSFWLAGGGSGIWQYNAVGEITGSENPETSIVMGGHHDSIVGNVSGTQGQDPMEYAPGVDDNGSAVVSALEMCKLISLSGYTPKHTIKFATYAAEEVGLWGSKDMAQKSLDSGEDLKIMINSDMIAHNSTPQSSWGLRVMPYTNSIGEAVLTAELVGEYSDLEPLFGYPNSSGSDSFSYFERGFNCVYFFEKDFTPYYHSYDDILENCDMEYFHEALKGSVATLIYFDNNPQKIEEIVVTDMGTGNSLLVEWEYDNTNIDHYEILWSDGTENFTDSTTDKSFTVTGLEDGVEYQILVSAVDSDGYASAGQMTTATSFSTPSIPMEIDISLNISSVTLDWSDNDEIDLAGYYLYKSDDLNGSFEKVNSTPIEVSEYEDSANFIKYYYYVTAVDEEGNESDPSDIVEGRAITLDQGLLIVDESRDQSGGPSSPTDEEMDSFYSNLLGTVYENIAEYDLNQTEAISLADISIYEVIFWHNNKESYNEVIKEKGEMIKRYLDAGGKILFSIQQPSISIMHNSEYPIDFDPESVISQIFKIGSSDYESSARLNKAIGVDGFGDLMVNPDKAPSNLDGYLKRIESITPIDGGEVIYKYGTDHQAGSGGASMVDMPIGIKYLSDNHNIVFTTFNPYYFEEEGVKQFYRKVFEDCFDLTVDISEGNLVEDSSLISAYPNPFNPSTNISFRLNSDADVKLTIHNVNGEEITQLINRTMSKGDHSLSFNGESLSSGIYFINYDFGKGIHTKKITLVK